MRRNNSIEVIALQSSVNSGLSRAGRVIARGNISRVAKIGGHLRCFKNILSVVY
jgi:hypothetical protein